MKAKTIKKNGTTGAFDPQVFLDTAGVARKVVEFRRGESIYSQGEAAESVMYVQKGGVKFSVVNGSGKEAVVAMFGPTDFFGEGCMAGQTVRMGTAGGLRQLHFWLWRKTNCYVYSMLSMSYPIISSDICWRITSRSKRI